MFSLTLYFASYVGRAWGSWQEGLERFGLVAVTVTTVAAVTPAPSPVDGF
jgi:hypothetical protein